MEHREPKPRAKAPKSGEPAKPKPLADTAHGGFPPIAELAGPRSSPNRESVEAERDFYRLQPLEDFQEIGLGDLDLQPLDRPNTASPPQASSVEPDIPPSSAEDGGGGETPGDASAEPVQPTARRRFYRISTPAWLVSLLLHVCLLCILATIQLESIDNALNVLRGSPSEAEVDLDQFELQAPALEAAVAQSETLTMPSTETAQAVELASLQPTLDPVVELPLDGLESNRLTERILPSSALGGSAISQLSSSLGSRSSATRGAMLERFGGTASSEKAVALALKWIADHQASSGGWSFAHSAVCRGACDGQGDLALATNGATAMALLPFLGAGQTHMEGQYKETVYRGLAFLINRMQVSSGPLPAGSWNEPGGRMYSHGLAAITVCEAYAMTRDPDLLQPAQLSLNYLIEAQDPRGGGWRYEPGQPGDTSVVGWCVMALKSGRMGNMVVPDKTFQGAQNFLDMVSTNRGAYYGYKTPVADLTGREATTAVGLLCQMYLGRPKQHPGMVEGVAFLEQVGPRIDDLYYTYYATQVMRHYGGPAWEKWNAALRDALIAKQEKLGHAAGSWTAQGRHAEKGGRLYATSLAAMILEVYYRHMPLYSEKSSQDDFEI